MLKTYGTEERTKPRIEVLRGWDPNNPGNRTRRAPITGSVTIKSGQVISLAYDGVLSEEGWNLGVTASTDIPYFAVQDSDDFDVVSSGVLTGLSSLDQIELQTPYFTASPTPAYSSQVALKANSTTGNVTTADLTTDDTLLGFASRFTGPVDIRASNPSATPDGDGKVLVLTLMTHFQRNVADAT